MARLITLIFSLFVTLTLFASTSDVLDREYPGYYNLGAERYELYYCHKNVARLLNHLYLAGAELSEITVVILLEVEGQREIYPSHTRFDGEFKWHVFFMHNGVIFDQNILYGEHGMPVADYFSLMLGSEMDLNDVVIRTVRGELFHQFFYSVDGDFKGYMPHEFMKRFVRGDEFPLESAQYLKWY
jgi:hypothetical protein